MFRSSRRTITPPGTAPGGYILTWAAAARISRNQLDGNLPLNCCNVKQLSGNLDGVVQLVSGATTVYPALDHGVPPVVWTPISSYAGAGTPIKNPTGEPRIYTTARRHVPCAAQRQPPVHITRGRLT